METIPIHISNRAKQEVQTILTSKKVPEGYCLRVGIRGGGCGGAGFFIGFDQPKEFDKKYVIDTLEVLIDKRHIMYLLDIELDFEERADEQGFVFNKPDVKN